MAKTKKVLVKDENGKKKGIEIGPHNKHNSMSTEFTMPSGVSYRLMKTVDKEPREYIIQRQDKPNAEGKQIGKPIREGKEVHRTGAQITGLYRFEKFYGLVD